LPHGPLPGKSGKTGAVFICPCFAQCHRFSKTYYALLPHRPALFCLISAEAYLLTGSLNHDLHD
jgi:hypothetical protein